MTAKHINSIILVALAVLLSSGCASIISDSTYAVAISSEPDNVRFMIKDKSGKKVSRGKTPAVVSLEAGAGFFKGQTYSVHFKKRGYERRIVEIKREIDGWYIANILFGGIIGLLIVDPITGAMWTLEDLNVQLPRKYAQLIREQRRRKGAPGVLHLVLSDDIPERMRPGLRRLTPRS